MAQSGRVLCNLWYNWINMATLNTLLVNGNSTTQTTQWAVGTFTNIDEGISAADGLEIGDDTNSSVDEFAYFSLSNVNADFGSMDTININIRYRVLGAQTNNRSLFAQVITDESTPVSLTTERTIATNITNTTATNSGVLSMTISGTPSKAQWDNALIRLRLNIVRNKGGDTNGIRVDTLELTGTYTAAAANNGNFFQFF